MGIEDLLFPKKCFGCRTGGSYICGECGDRLAKVGQVCPMCERPSIDGWVHKRCRKPRGVDRLIATYKYTGTLQKALKRVKFSSSYRILDDVFEVWRGEVRRLLGEIENESTIITAVPMYYKKERKRGFNQANILGEKLSKEMKTTYSEMLKRMKNTKPMYGLSQKERRENLSQAFELTKKGREKVENYKKVILVDDVWTTGSTIRECCKTLKRGGAKEVWGVVVSR